MFSTMLTSKPAQAEISPTDLQRNKTAAQSLDGPLCSTGAETRSLVYTLPVLVDEALVLCVRIDGRQSRRHLPVDLHHFMVQEGGDVEILLQDLLPWSRWCKWGNDRGTEEHGGLTGTSLSEVGVI